MAAAKPPDDVPLQPTNVVAVGEPVVAEVVVAFPLGKDALSVLQARAGPAVAVRDLREPGPSPDLVLCPPGSPQLIARMRQHFPGARVIVVELEDWLESRHTQGPIGRALSAGASGYYVASDSEALAGFLTEVAAGASLSIGRRVEDDPGPEGLPSGPAPHQGALGPGMDVDEQALPASVQDGDRQNLRPR